MNITRGLKIQERWLKLILNGQKTMEVRSTYLKIRYQRIALGNSDTGNVEGYATVRDVLKIPFLKIAKYENEHLATKWLLSRYEGRPHLYGYILKDVEREQTQIKVGFVQMLIYHTKRNTEKTYRKVA